MTMKITTDEETEIAMTAVLMKMNQPDKTCYRKKFADLDNLWEPASSAAEVDCAELG